jgi:hypothetical protein
MVDVEKILALLAVVAGAFKAITSALKDIHDIRSAKQRRPPTKKKRRKK